MRLAVCAFRMAYIDMISRLVDRCFVPFHPFVIPSIAELDFSTWINFAFLRLGATLVEERNLAKQQRDTREPRPRLAQIEFAAKRTAATPRPAALSGRGRGRRSRGGGVADAAALGGSRV